LPKKVFVDFGIEKLQLGHVDIFAEIEQHFLAFIRILIERVGRCRHRLDGSEVPDFPNALRILILRGWPRRTLTERRFSLNRFLTELNWLILPRISFLILERIAKSFFIPIRVR
jgi:hypothetical protein